MNSFSSSFSPVSSLLILFTILLPSSTNAYVDWAAFPEGSFVGPGVNQFHDTDFCDVVRNNSIDLLDALKGRNLSIAVQYGPGFDFFEFRPDQKLSNTNPGGMIPAMLDELARRGRFQWRDSFVAYNINSLDVLGFNGTGKWDRMLNWTVSNFDVAVDKWFLTTGRLQNETVFLHSWFDASLILVDQGKHSALNLLGFGAPFEVSVWIAIVCTIFFTAVFMMVIEGIEGRRDGRSIKQWLGDQLYSSNLAISQHFQFSNPKTGAGRVFLSFFAFWAMLIGATYTANLASLLVEDALASPVQTIEQAMDNQLSICVHGGSASEAIIGSLYPRAKIYDKFFRAQTPELMYEALKNGDCEILLGTRQEYDIFGIQQKYGCILVQAGRELHPSTASFAVDLDPLNCHSVLGHVLNIHLNAMSVDGNLTKYWATYLNGIKGTCIDESEQAIGLRRRMVETEGDDVLRFKSTVNNRHRKLIKTTMGSAAASAASSEKPRKEKALSLSGMFSIFMVQAVGTGLSILCAMYSICNKRRTQNALARQKHFHQNISAKSETQRKYEAMKQDMADHMLTMKIEMMTQMDNFFRTHNTDEFHSARSSAVSDLQARQYSRRYQEETLGIAKSTNSDSAVSDNSIALGTVPINVPYNHEKDLQDL